MLALHIDYFSDMLCVWAWIAERRNQELQDEWSDRVQLRHQFMDLFSNAELRIGKGWSD